MRYESTIINAGSASDRAALEVPYRYYIEWLRKIKVVRLRHDNHAKARIQTGVYNMRFKLITTV
jgi:hypothetical protein